MARGNEAGPRAPRVVVVVPEPARRALLARALAEEGYEALCVPTLMALLTGPAPAPGAAPAGVILLEEDALAFGWEQLLRLAQRRHGVSEAVLLAGADSPVPPGDWALVLRRPLRVGEVVRGVTGRLPAAA